MPVSSLRPRRVMRLLASSSDSAKRPLDVPLGPIELILGQPLVHHLVELRPDQLEHLAAWFGVVPT